MLFLTTSISSRYPLTSNQLITSSNPRTHVNIQDGRVIVQNVQGQQSQGYAGNIGRGAITARVKKQEAILELDDEQQDFMEDGLEGFNSDCEDLQLNTTLTFMTDHVDAYDSDCNEAPTASTIFMARISPTRSVNVDDAGPSYDTDILYEIWLSLGLSPPDLRINDPLGLTSGITSLGLFISAMTVLYRRGISFLDLGGTSS
ncbi:hypothetical protein Tco_0960465 [Tanacetum coccineum]